MKIARIAISLLAVSLLFGCASSPRALASHKAIPGGAYTGKADNNRPENLKYQKLPDDVEYVVASDSLVVAVHGDLKKALESDEGVVLAKYLFLMPGSWESIKDDEAFKSKFKRQKGKFEVQVTKKKKFKFHYAIPQNEQSAEKAWNVVKQRILQSEQASEMPAEAPKIRSIGTEEMVYLSKFSPFKMVEPLFVVNDRFLLGYNKKGELELVDELPYYIPFYDEAMEIISQKNKKK